MESALPAPYVYGLAADIGALSAPRVANAHRTLDAAVLAAYGWHADISDDDLLGKLLELNLSRGGAAATADADE